MENFASLRDQWLKSETNYALKHNGKVSSNVSLRNVVALIINFLKENNF